jgi:Uncharacterized protein conserved in bacteria (DUF2320).
MHDKKAAVAAAVCLPSPQDCRRTLLLLGLAAALAVAAPRVSAIEYEPLHFGALEVIPDFNTSVTPTGSVLLPNGQEEDSELLLFKPRVTAVVSGGQHRFSSSFEVHNGNYSAPGSTGYFDWKLENQARLQFDGGRSLRFRTENFSTHEGAGTTNVPKDGREPARFATESFDTSFEQSLWDRRGQLVLDAGSFSKTYLTGAESGNFTNRQDRYVGGSFRYRLLPGADLQMQYRARDIAFEAAFDPEAFAPVDRREVFTYVGALWEKSLDLLGKVRLSSGYKQTDLQASTPLADTATWETNLRWQPLEASIVNLAADHSVRDMPGPFGDSTSSSYRYNWEHQWAKQLKTTLNGSYSENVDTSTRRADTGMGLKLRLDYAYSRWVDMFIALGHDRRKTGSAVSFSQGTFMLGIAASFDRLFGKK